MDHERMRTPSPHSLPRAERMTHGLKRGLSGVVQPGRRIQAKTIFDENGSTRRLRRSLPGVFTYQRSEWSHFRADAGVGTQLRLHAGARGAREWLITSYRPACWTALSAE